MAMFSHMLPGWHCRSLLIWDFVIPTIFSWPLIHRLPFFQASGHFFLHQKTFCSKEEVETVFKDFFAWKPLKFSHRDIINLVYWWQNCIDVQGLYFDWLKHCLDLLNQEEKLIQELDIIFQTSWYINVITVGRINVM